MEKNKTVEKNRLGRGLSALIPPTARPAPSPAERSHRPHAAAEGRPESVREIPLASIVPNALQPRQTFEPTTIEELAASIAAHGVLQPVMVRPRGQGRYELIAGERRYRAAQQAGLSRIPALIREMTDDESLTVALIENIQREDLNPIEAARGYRQLLEQFGLTQTELARQIGKAQPTIANSLRLLDLATEIQDSIAAGQITLEHGKVLLSVSDLERRREVWREAVDLRLNVKETRRRAEAANALSPSMSPRVRARGTIKDVHWQAMEDQFRALLGLRVTLKPHPSGRSELVVQFASPEEAEHLIERLQL